MKPTKRLFSIAIAALLASAAVQAQTALDDVLKSKTLKVAIPTDSAPYGYVGTDLKPIGLDNAIKYTPPGGTVNLEIASVDGAPLLRVDDSGPGIAPDERERVLDRFYRIAGSDASGSGLGLPIVKAVAVLHGATLALLPSPSLGGLRVEVRFLPAA